jgi:hypothetical protein
MKNNTLLKEISLIKIFADDMISELNKNSHKDSILKLNNFEQIITELEYHKAKLFLAIRVKNKNAIREYLADIGNYLIAIGNLFDVYSDERDENNCVEINKNVEIFISKKISEQSINQKLI